MATKLGGENDEATGRVCGGGGGWHTNRAEEYVPPIILYVIIYIILILFAYTGSKIATRF